MKKMIGMMLLLVAVSGFAMAGLNQQAPEIDPGVAGSAGALLGGALLVIRSRKK